MNSDQQQMVFDLEEVGKQYAAQARELSKEIDEKKEQLEESPDLDNLQKTIEKMENRQMQLVQKAVDIAHAISAMQEADTNENKQYQDVSKSKAFLAAAAKDRNQLENLTKALNNLAQALSETQPAQQRPKASKSVKAKVGS